MAFEAGFETAFLLEDEENLAVALKIALKRMGVKCVHATTLERARKILSQGPPPEFMLLDRGVPDGDGLDLCREVRGKGYRGAILILTAAGAIDDRVDGLREGADDYLPKPFSWDELEARVIALSRRFARQDPPAAATIKPELPASGVTWTLDHDRLRMHGPGGWVELTPLEFKLASRLVDAQGKILTREDLLKNVWGFTFLPKTRTVDHFMGRLRKHFERDPEQPVHFITVRGAGYRFEP